MKKFPHLQVASTKYYLGLRRYLKNRPESFFDENVYNIYLDWLLARDKLNRAELKEYFSEFDTDINRALLFLREINSYEWHDKSLNTGDDYDMVRFIDRHLHPTYLRLTEAVLTPLLKVVAFFNRLDRGKGTEGLDIWTITQELENTEKSLIESYKHIIRNGIGHGGITFCQYKIRYKDKRGNEETFDNSSLIRIFDDLVDTCNGLAAALKVFFLISRNGSYSQPREFLIEELQEETSTPWWAIDGCVESELAGKSNLIIYARPNTYFFAKAQWSIIQSGLLAEFFSPGYDRYTLSLHSKKSLPGWTAFDGNKLRRLRELKASDFSQYQGVIEGDLIFFVPKISLPSWMGKIDTFIKSFSLIMPLHIQKRKESLGIPQIICRNSEVHRNSWGAILNADIVIDESDNASLIEVIHTFRKRIVKLAMKQARKQNRFNLATYLPIGFANIKVFRRDYRARRLNGFGLKSDLVCNVKFQRLRRIQSPDLFGSTVETKGKWRIAWNKAWLESS